MQELAAQADSDRFQKVLTAYSRPARIVRGQKIGADINPDLFEHEEEKKLLQAGQSATGKIKQMSVALLFARAIASIYDETSISELFD